MVFIANNWDEANEILLELSKCKTCKHFSALSLFETKCNRINRIVSHESMCECHAPFDKIISYRINKTVRMLSDYSGISDFSRMLDYHERNGTEDQFLKYCTK